ncbi:hypothetical protein BH11MYX3_BH11MYX3_05190 [soil metagenome]
MRSEGLIVVVLALAGGCGGDSDETVSLAITSPAPGATFMRDTLDGNGSLVAAVAMEIDVGGTPARVAISLDTAELGVVDADGHATAALVTAGPATLTATAFDEAGTPLASAVVEVIVIEPTVTTCRGWLDLYSVQYTVGPINPGVADPVTATMPINGMPFRSGGAVRTKMFGDCTLIKSLAEAAPMLRARQIVEVTDLGVYNYRCIGNTGTPPNCPNGISEHAYGNAIDLAVFKDAAGTSYSVAADFVIDPAPEKTCTAATVPGKDTFLHELICSLKAAKLWNIVLTPNYNADHRDHFHVDLTAGANFID